MDDGACVGQAPSRSRDGEEYRDQWFPAPGQPYVTAMETCFYCSVRRKCVEFRNTLEPEYGVWGGRIQKRGSAARRPSRDKKAG